MRKTYVQLEDSHETVMNGTLLDAKVCSMVFSSLMIKTLLWQHMLSIPALENLMQGHWVPGQSQLHTHCEIPSQNK